MRVMIMGGGVAGTVAALAVRQAGHEPVVYEASPGSSSTGWSRSNRQLQLDEEAIVNLALTA